MRKSQWSNFVTGTWSMRRPPTIVVFAVLAAVMGMRLVVAELGPQKFRKPPQDTNVTAGQMATLDCSVENKAGVLLWTKDGFSMGSDRDLPGFPRYKMFGSETDGEYNLMIHDVELSDDATYECQVGPRPGHGAIKHAAYLSVQIPPETPEIEDHPNGTVVEVPHEQLTLNLTCVSQNGKPAADLKWFRNDEAVTTNIQYVVEEVGNKLQNARSVLTISPKETDNDALFRCQASNAASTGKTLETVVSLSVMHPPNPPTITGYKSGTVVRTGDTIKLVCESNGGNPFAELYWYKNDLEIDFSHHTGSGKAVNELFITVEPSDNEAVYRCEASNKVTPKPLTAEVKFKVQFGPEYVKLSGDRHAKAGETITLICTTAISNPPAKVTWYGRGVAITPDHTPSVTPSPKGGFVTTSNISVALTNRSNEMLYQCQGFNEALGKTETDSVTLTVMYPPEHKGITGYQNQRLEAGNSLGMTCMTHGGNPLPTLTWWKGDEELQGEQRQNGKIVTNLLTILLKAEDNGAAYRCNASNLATPEPLIKTISLDVLFAPSGLTLSTTPTKPKAGTDLIITCKSGSSNPVSELSWWKEGNRVMGRSKDTVDAEWGGKSSVSELVIIPTADDDGEIYACRATNSKLDRAVSDAITLDISYKPVFGSEAPTSHKVTEGGSDLLNLTSLGNPQPITYTWYKDSVLISRGDKVKRDVTTPHIVIDGPLFNMTNVSRADAGVYTCEAANSEGATNHSINLIVNYPASITYTNDGVIVDQNMKAMLECHTDAIPMATITWSRVGYNMSHVTIQDDGTGKSRVTVHNVTKDDSGTFVCKAANGIKEAVTKNVRLLVKYAPEIDRGLALRKAAARKGETGNIICKAEGAPNVTFSWTKGKDKVNVTQSKYKMMTEKLDVVQYQSILTVFNVTQDDYGKYRCAAKNLMGSDTWDIDLDDTSQPDPPHNIHVVNTTHDSITLAWTPGFNGGAPQRFNVQYKPVGSKAHKTDQVVPRNASVYTIKGLERATEYNLTVQAENDFGASPFQSKTAFGTTERHASALLSSGDNVPIIIILTVSIIGMILLGLNVLLILFFIRRRRRKLEKDASESASNANTVEMFSAPTITEDSKSYTTFDHHSLDDYPEDPRIYDPDDELKRFLPPPAYGAFDPYGPHPPSHYYGPTTHLGPASYGPHRVTPSPKVDNQRPYVVGPVRPSWEDPRKYDPYGSMPRMAPPTDDTDDYANQLRKVQKNLTSSGTLEPPGRIPPRREDKGPASLPPTRAPPPPPPTRSSSKGAAEGTPPRSMPPIPSRNYAPDDVPRAPVPRYVPPPAFRAVTSSNHNRPRSSYDGPVPSQPSYPAPQPPPSTLPKPSQPSGDVRGSSHGGSVRAPSVSSLTPRPTPPPDVQGHLV